MYDVIIVGGRCAGASTAMLLARAARRVLVVDRTTFPSDTLSGHAIQPSGVATLARWGLLERVRATGTPFVPDVRFDVGPIVLDGRPVPVDGISDTVCARRTVIDALLVDAAREAGAEVREGFTFADLIVESGRVAGITGRDASGATVDLRAAIVVGADGVHSPVARAAGAGTYHELPAVTANAYSYWSGVDVDGVELYVRPNRFMVAVPTNDDLVIINQGIARAEAAHYRADIGLAFADTLRLAPSLAERVAGGSRVERFRFTTATQMFFRRSHGPGWALVGDAGLHLDPVTAQGMRNAFEHAELLARAIDDGLDGGPAALDAATSAYARARDDAVMPMYQLTHQLAKVDEPPPPEMHELFGALAGNKYETARFLGLMAGSVPVTEFLDPGNVGRIVGAAQRAVA